MSAPIVPGSRWADPAALDALIPEARAAQQQREPAQAPRRQPAPPTLDDASLDEPIVRAGVDGFTFEWPPLRIVLEFSRLRDNREGDPVAEVRAGRYGGPDIHYAKVALLSTRSLADFVKACRERDDSLPWARLLQVAAAEAVRRARLGAKPVWLSDVPIGDEDGADFLLEPLALATLPVILFGDGGAGKSLLALAMAASIADGRPLLGRRPSRTARVALLDYEFDAAQHAARLRRLAGEPPPGVLYVPCSKPLAADTERLRAILDKEGIEYIVLDSVALACDGPPEAAEVVVRFFAALRALGRGALLVAHVNRAGDTDRPFGSAFWHNAARVTWYVKVEHDIGGTMLVGLFNKKSNIGPRLAPLGFLIRWGETIEIERVPDLADIPDIARHVPLSVRLRDALRGGARTTAELAAATDEKVETVDRTLRRLRDRQQVVAVVGPDGIRRWGLVAQEPTG